MAIIQSYYQAKVDPEIPPGWEAVAAYVGFINEPVGTALSVCVLSMLHEQSDDYCGMYEYAKWWRKKYEARNGATG